MEDTITVKELKEKMDRGEKLHLVDVREPDEHEEFNIGGTLIPLGRIKNYDFDELKPLRDLESEIIVYCRSGNRSGQAMDILHAMGYKVKNLEGGMLKWKEVFEDKKKDKE